MFAISCTSAEAKDIARHFPTPYILANVDKVCTVFEQNFRD